jgi:hypothetical protein
MSQAFKSRVLRTGTRLQSGIPKKNPMPNPIDATGMLLRGVVTATYVVDDENHPLADKTDVVPTAVYCDVLTFGRQWRFLPRCIVAQERSGLHSGHVWKPRACSMTLTGDPVDMNAGTNPANLDGDHVLVGFMDGNSNQPVIMRALPHPAADVGNEEFGVGHRLKLKVADGDPDFYKHNGSYYGIHKNGDFYIDTTHANDGQLLDSTGEWGHEPEPPTDGKGSVVCELPQDARWTVKLMDMSDPLNPVPVLIKEMTKDGNVDLYGENYVYEITINDLSDPENPVPISLFRLKKDSFEAEIVDKAVMRLLEGKWEVELDDLTKRIIVTPSLIELGAEGASDKAVLHSLVQAELDSISDAIAGLKDDINNHTHPLPEYIIPLIPINTGPVNPASDPSDDGLVCTTPPLQSLTEYSPGDTASSLVTIDS